ncbi:MAG: hypothetical protein O3C20_22450 [Verrucomicrobia bacterium]|nr:hypothetical protein [Verrucomicrobiota bacterium]
MPFSKRNRALLWFALIISPIFLIYQGWDLFIEDGEPILQGNDDSGYFLWLNSWVVDGDIDLKNNLVDLNTLTPDIRHEWINNTHPTTGHVLNKYPVGWALMNWPAYKLTHLLYGFIKEHPRGTEPIYFTVIWLYQLALGLLSLVLCHRILRRFLPDETALWALLATWLASPLLYYQVARLGMVHNQVFFLSMVIIRLSLKLRDTSTAINWMLLGFASGMLLISRPTAVAYLLIPFWCCLHQIRSNPKAEYKRLGIGIIAGAIPLLVQLGIWKEIYGSWFVFSYTNESFFFLKPALWSSLFSNRHGLFNWHPLLLIGAVGWIIASFRKNAFPKVWIVSFALVVYINSAWWCWWFGSSFGNRSYEVSILFFMAGLGFIYEQFKSSKIKLRILSAATLTAILWNVLILSEYMTNHIDRELAVSYLERLTGWF